MEDIRYFLIGGITALIIKKTLELDIPEYEVIQTPVQEGGNREIDLTGIVPSTSEHEDAKKVLANYDEPDKFPFFPMFENPNQAKLQSPTKSVHLVIPGLMPAPPNVWKGYDSDKIFYMPNDLKPHMHGEAQHHMPDMSFEITTVYSLKKMKEQNVKDKTIEVYRKKLNQFNNGFPSTPIETWIHWKIPSDKKEYPKLIVKKNSIIWWDYENWHNLNIVNEEDYKNNLAQEANLIPKTQFDDKGNEKQLQIAVTIMDKVGTFYFLCSITGHSENGHKIIIEVVD